MANHPYYLVWSGSLNMGDTPGVFTDAQFVGLILQIPITITYLSDETAPAQFLLTTTEVEIFNQKTHPVYWDWTPGTALPTPVGHIDDTEFVPGKPEFHQLSIPRTELTLGKHWLTILVNAEIPAGLRDDFILKRIEAHNSIGAKIGW
ncbi:hypothetical protein [Tuwongella immobilis]|uniref:Uncharacterized protein n=1 Tax=Tuwongella immobilis TaxID=692036 RepID=A0A6C2YXB4_9BACT|nr:hypothetical protein [Tuwongella immobilis]VIP05462.1 unnamed protein product [Tuwongella immobilis]VTS08280.1 unnamed protein product [Tuwongella immobilis]